MSCDTFNDLSTGYTSETSGVNTRVGDAGTCSEIPYNYPTSTVAPTKVTQDLKEYLARPRIVGAGSVPATVGRFFTSYISPTGLTSLIANLSTRLSGAYGFRATLRYTVQIAHTPFQQGLHVLAWQYGANSVTGDNAFDRGSRPQTVTYLPSVRINLEENDSATLDVPFLWNYEYWPLAGSAVSLPYGSVSVTSVLPTPSLATTSAPSFKVYFSLHDVELIGSTPLADNIIVVQSGDSIMNTVRGVASIADKELRRTKLVSNTLEASSKFFNMTNLGTPAWLTSVLAKTAASYGYSAPAVQTPVERKLDNHTLDPVHIDVPISASKLTPFQSNALQLGASMGGSSEDVASFDYVLSKYSQIFRGSFGTSTTANSYVYASLICLNHFWFRSPAVAALGGNLALPNSSTPTTNAFQPSILMYAADSFRYWRGGLKFKFSFAKTPFHAGHVIVGFVPRDTYATAGGIANLVPVMEVAAGAVQPTSYSKTFDLRSGTEFEFEVPYMATRPYTSVNDSVGSISMAIFNPIVASSSEISSNIGFIVEVAAMPDLEFAAYVPTSLAPINVTTGIVELQSGEDIMAPIVETSALVIGEKFRSFKQLMMIPSWFSIVINNLQIGNYWIPPWFHTASWSLATPMATNASANWAFTNGSKVASMYVYGNGSSRLSFLSSTPAPNGFTISILSRANPNNYSSASFGGLGNVRNKGSYQNTSALLASPTAHTVDIPLYATVQRVAMHVFNGLTANWTSGLVPTLDTAECAAVPFFSLRNVTGGDVTINISRAAGEDATVAAFVGPPPCILFNALATVSPNSDTMFV